LHDLFRRVGREYWPLRANLHLPEDVKSRAIQRLSDDFATFLGRRVARTDRSDGLKLVFDDGAWVLLRLSGTEPLMRVYSEAATEKESARICEDARAWIFSDSGGAI
jgi:phosphoglucomutase